MSNFVLIKDCSERPIIYLDIESLAYIHIDKANRSDSVNLHFKDGGVKTYSIIYYSEFVEAFEKIPNVFILEDHYERNVLIFHQDELIYIEPDYSKSYEQNIMLKSLKEPLHLTMTSEQLLTKLPLKSSE